MKRISFLAERGTTFVELLMAMMIGAIVLMALAIPYSAQGRFFGMGRARVEAQRDADMVLRSMSLIARKSTSYTITHVAAGDDRVNFTVPGCGAVFFEGGPNFQGTTQKGQLRWQDGCASPAVTAMLIDGVNSKMAVFNLTQVSTKIIKVNLKVTYQNEQSETMEKQFFLRNGS